MVPLGTGSQLQDCWGGMNFPTLALAQTTRVDNDKNVV
jgi:hypothetical protein